MIEKRPAFERYWEHVSTRPASRRAVEIDDTLLAAQQQPKKIDGRDN
jgi:glutathione S-transferase